MAFTISCSSGGGGSPNERTFHGEIGTVYVGYANLFSTPLDMKYFITDGTDEYMKMYSKCGNKAQSVFEGTESEGSNWLC